MEVNLCIFFFICMAIGDAIIERGWGVGNPSTGLTQTHFCVCPEPALGFPMSYVMVFFMFNELRWDMIVHFVDIGGIVYYYCLNFLFIIYICINKSNCTTDCCYNNILFTVLLVCIIQWCFHNNNFSLFLQRIVTTKDPSVKTCLNKIHPGKQCIKSCSND